VGSWVFYEWLSALSCLRLLLRFRMDLYRASRGCEVLSY